MVAGKFISIEGGEGVGKSTFGQALAKVLQTKGKPVVTTHEPGGTDLAEAIRELFMNPPKNESIQPLTELYLVSAARHQHVNQVINPSLAAGNWVLCDRFYDSSRVYQGTLGGVDSGHLEEVLNGSISDCHPDMTFLLDCDVELAQKRLTSRNANNQVNDRFDLASQRQHNELRQGFLELAERFPDRLVILDASLTTEEMLNQAVGKLKARFGNEFV